MDISIVVRGREDGATLDAILGLASVADDLGYPVLIKGQSWSACYSFAC